MQALVKIASYKWYDPVVAPPLPRNKEELRTLNGRSAIGALAGMTAGAIGGYMAGGHLPSMKGSRLGGAFLGGTVGLTGGSVAGQVLGSRKVLKDRIRRGEESDPEEERRMIERYSPEYPGARLSGMVKKPSITFSPENL